MLVLPESPSKVLERLIIDEQQVCVYLQPFSR